MVANVQFTAGDKVVRRSDKQRVVGIVARTSATHAQVVWPSTARFASVPLHRSVLLLTALRPATDSDWHIASRLAMVEVAA